MSPLPNNPDGDNRRSMGEEVKPTRVTKKEIARLMMSIVYCMPKQAGCEEHLMHATGQAAMCVEHGRMLERVMSGELLVRWDGREFHYHKQMSQFKYW